MNQQEWKDLRMTVVDMLCGDDLIDKTPRTLLYGVGRDFANFHTYFDGEVICVCGWNDGDDDVYEIIPNDDEHYIPDGMLRPEYCDFEFCQLLLKLGHTLPFTEAYWYGERKELRTL